MRMNYIVGVYNKHGRNKKFLQNSGGNPEGKITLSRPRWEEIIKEDLKEMGFGLNSCGSELDPVTES
jgi:hypothetical protein